MRKTKKCRNCGDQFEPFTSLEKYCRKTECRVRLAMENLEKIKKQQVKQEKNRLKEKKESLKSLSDYKKELQTLVNKYVRLRDRNNGCISCNKKLKAKFDAGHFYSVGSYPQLRFDLMNIHGQCVPCNQHLRGNLHEYRKNIVKKIGLCNFIDLERRSQTSRHFMMHEIIQMIDDMKKELKKMM
jgi:hypothetical protein